jgi:hypothetical protein
MSVGLGTAFPPSSARTLLKLDHTLSRTNKKSERFLHIIGLVQVELAVDSERAKPARYDLADSILFSLLAHAGDPIRPQFTPVRLLTVFARTAAKLKERSTRRARLFV